jgi:hypothetical protein
MTTAEMAKYIGQTGRYNGIRGLEVEVVVIDARQSWGELQLQIQPTSGSGSTWVSVYKLYGIRPHPRELA